MPAAVLISTLKRAHARPIHLKDSARIGSLSQQYQLSCNWPTVRPFFNELVKKKIKKKSGNYLPILSIVWASSSLVSMGVA